MTQQINIASVLPIQSQQTIQLNAEYSVFVLAILTAIPYRWHNQCFYFVTDKRFYRERKSFLCIDGSKVIPFEQVNDDYCDCEDGSDEPGKLWAPGRVVGSVKLSKLKALHTEYSWYCLSDFLFLLFDEREHNLRCRHILLQTTRLLSWPWTNL